MQKPRIDDELTVLTGFGETKVICAEISDDPARPDGTLLTVMARGPFEEGQQCWLVDNDGSKIGAVVQRVAEQTIDSEVMLSTTFA